MKRNNLLFLFLVVVLSLPCKAQMIDQELINRIIGKSRLSEIIKEVETYLDPKIVQHNGNDRYYKQSKMLHRWALYMSNRLTGDGDITDVDKMNYEAFMRAGYSVNNSDMNNPQTSYGSWSQLGPTSVNSSDNRLGVGRCDRITFHPTDANTFFIGTPAGGLWKTTSDGSSWISYASYLTTLGISGIVVDYTNTNTLYLLTGDGDSNLSNGLVQLMGYTRTSTGVYKSTDGGITWVQTGPLSNSSYVGYKLVQDPDDPGTLLAATSVGIYRTTNGGTSWTLVTANSRYYDIEYDPNNADGVYAGGNSQALYSTNSGSSWSTATFNIGISGSGRVELAVSPANGAYVYALTGSAYSGGFSGLYRSTNNGVNYTQRCNSPNIMDNTEAGLGNGSQGSYDLALAVSPTDANRVLTGGINVWSSTDGGTTMTAIMFDGSGNRKIHTDIHDLKYNPLSGYLYCANDGGLYKSTNNGSTWTKLSNGISTGQIYHMAGTESSSSTLAIGLQDNGLKSRTSSTTIFNHNGTGDGFGVAIKPDDITHGYGGINSSVYAMDLNGGLSNDFAGLSEFYPTIAVHQTTGNTAWCGYTDVYKTTNGGASWLDKGSNGSWALTTCPSNTTRVYAAGGANGFANDASGGGLSRSDNSGDTWITVFTTANAPFNKITSIGVDPSSSANVWITLGGFTDGEKVYRSTNTGGGWTNVSGSLPNVPINSIAIDQDNNAYVGTDFGVYYRGNSQSDWTPFSTNLPRVPVSELVINQTAGVIRAATFGRGVYSTNLYSTCVSSLSLNSSYYGYEYYEASSTITSFGNIAGGAGTQVFFKSGGTITFTPGFAVAAGNEFKAYVGNCGNGIPTMAAVSAKLPSPSTLDWLNNGFLEVSQANSNGCTINVKLKNTKSAMIVISDGKNIVYQSKIPPSTTSHVVNYNFLAGKNYRALLLMDGELVHWQELLPLQ